MTTISALLISTLAGLSTVLGSFVIFFNIPENNINEFFLEVDNKNQIKNGYRRTKS